MNDRCVDCRRPATRTYGTIAICDTCWQVEKLRIFAHRPDLRDWGIGQPEGDYVRCDMCNATWTAAHDHQPCPWCLDRLEHQAEAQQAIDRGRFRDYLTRISNGDRACLQSAIDLACRYGWERRLAQAVAAVK